MSASLLCRWTISLYDDDDDVDEQRQTHGSNCGQALVDKLKAGDPGRKAEILFLTIVCGRYLMNNCAQ